MLRGAHAPRVLFPAPRRKLFKRYPIQSGASLILSARGENPRLQFQLITAVICLRSTKTTFYKACCTDMNITSMSSLLDVSCQITFIFCSNHKSNKNTTKEELFSGRWVKFCTGLNRLARIGSTRSAAYLVLLGSGNHSID